MSSKFRHPVRVYIENTDATGLVFHGQYLNFMERARTEYLRIQGYGKNTIHDYNGIVVVHSLDIAYKSPAFLDDELDVGVVISRLTPASFTCKQDIYRGEELLIEANVKLACLNKETRRPVKIPYPIYRSLEAEMANLIVGEK